MDRRAAQGARVIRVENIYHMLAYAFRALQEPGYRDVAAESFDNAADLLAEILVRGARSQVKRGLGCGYSRRTEALATVRGKVEMADSLKTRSVLTGRLVCTYDEFSPDTPMNRVLKATLKTLARAGVAPERKKEIRRVLAYFGDVRDVGLSGVDWNFRYDRNNQTYRMLIAVCRLVAKGLIQTQADGTVRVMDVLDDQSMHRLYEKFILEYYRKEHPDLSADASFVAWALDDGFDELLPAMQTDITLSRGPDVLIIDAKYYSHVLQTRYERQTVHSANLYQIFSYVKNKEASCPGPGSVSGLLLYAATDEELQPNVTYRMSGNRIGVATLDLGRPFDEIRADLDAIREAHFGPR